MALCAKRNDEEFFKRDTLKLLTVANLITCMSRLSDWGYLYKWERAYSDYGKPLWEDDSQRILNAYWLTDQWQEKYKRFPVTSIQMTFRHFLTDEEKYLYVKSETAPQGDCVLVWISDGAFEDSNIYRKGTLIRDMPPLFEKLLVANHLILPEKTFKELDLTSIWPEEVPLKHYFSSLLYERGYRPLREGWASPKVDHHNEQSMAWAGEYRNIHDSSDSPTYYYFFFAKRDYEEWDCDYYDGEPRCIWTEPERNFYIARSHTPLDKIVIHGEPVIVLENIPGTEQVNTYLNNCFRLDQAVNHIFDDEYNCM